MYLGFFGLGRSAGEKYVTLPMQPATPSNQTLTAWVGTQLAGFERSTGEPAEAALLVAHDRQHQGIGTLLFEYLADVARRNGIHRFEASRALWPPARNLRDSDRQSVVYAAAAWVDLQTLFTHLGIRQVDRDYETLRIDRTTRVLTGRR